MSRFVQLSMASLVAAVLGTPAVARAGDDAPLSCSVTVEHTLNNVAVLSFARDFIVAVDAPYAVDFSTPTRFRSFDAQVAVVDGEAVVSIRFDADVSVFNAVAFDAELKLRNGNAQATSGSSAFFSSVPGAAGAHRTTYTLGCARAR